MNTRNSLILLLSLLALPAWAEETKSAKALEAAGQAVDQAVADKVDAVAGTMAAGETPPMTAEQQAMMAAWEKASTPGAQHQQLAEHFVGSWATKQSMWMDPAAEPMVHTGKATTVALFGNRTLRMDFEGEAMGQAFQGIGYTGYDNVTGKYYSTWVDNLSTGFMLTQGEYDAATKTYTFRGQMADPMNPSSMTPLRNVLRIIDADHHTFEMHETHDGKEARTMMIEYTRIK